MARADGPLTAKFSCSHRPLSHLGPVAEFSLDIFLQCSILIVKE